MAGETRPKRRVWKTDCWCCEKKKYIKIVLQLHGVVFGLQVIVAPGVDFSQLRLAVADRFDIIFKLSCIL